MRDGVDYAAALRLLLDAAAVVPHTDADGLASGAIALRARGEGAERATLLGRGQNPWDGAAPLPDGTLAVLDWGVRRLDRPALFVDHHAPEAEAGPGQIVISGYGAEPEISTAALMRRVAPDAPAWLAAVGAVGDLGDRAFELPECASAPKTAVRKLVPLVNAPRRLGDGPVREALALLVEHDDPRDALKDPRVEVLETSRQEWRSAYDAIMKIGPRVRGDIALIRFSAPYQVHPLVAQAWMRRLAPRVVIAANDDYLPGLVNFAARGGAGDLRALLRDALPGVEGEFAHGHDRATGGSLAPEEFDRLLANLGFDE